MVTRTNVEESRALSNVLSWFQTIKQPTGFCGPVVHYWSNSLNFTAPGTDWRLEGLVSGFLLLAEKTKNDSFVDLAIECGEFALANLREDGSFENGAFEANPSMGFVSQPHACAVDIALLRLGIFLQAKKDARAQRYIEAAAKNIDDVFFPRFWNEKEKTFQQYARGQFDHAPNLFVPNKIATACEALVLLAEATGKHVYVTKATQAAEKILELQSDDALHRGGIYQSNDREQIITFYTARCISPLLLLHEKTKDKRFLDSAKNAAAFVAAQQLPSGGFAFGFEGNEKKIYPVFGAGTGDILRSLVDVGGHSSVVEKGMTFLLSLRQSTGGFDSFVGLNHDEGIENSWMDHVAVAGWSDKAFRFLASRTKGEIVSPTNGMVYEVACDDGTLRETPHGWSVSSKGRTIYYADKQEMFANGDPFWIKRMAYSIGNSKGLLSPVGRKVSKILAAR